MRIVALALCGLIALSVLAGSQEQRERIPVGIRKAMEKQRLPTVPPLFEPQHSPTNIAQLKGDAEELAELSQEVSTEIEQVAKGLLPKGLNEKLKRIEKLSKKLRSQLYP